MSHVTCPFCGSNEHTSGYGLAVGPMGSYTFCDGCDELIEFIPDLEGMPDDIAERIKSECLVFEERLAEARRKPRDHAPD